MDESREPLNDVSVVIPTSRSNNHTIETVPDEVDTVVRKDNGLNVARNNGVREAQNDWIVLLDDDTEFKPELIRVLLHEMSRTDAFGLNDFFTSGWILGRFMLFHKTLWEEVGGFDESRDHGGDTDFAIRCEKHGGDVRSLPRNILPHYDSETKLSKLAHLEWIWYLFRRHPRAIGGEILLSVVQNLQPSSSVNKSEVTT